MSQACLHRDEEVFDANKIVNKIVEHLLAGRPWRGSCHWEQSETQ